MHYLSVSKRAAGLPFHTIAHEEPAPDAARCELRVLGVERVALAGEAAARWGPEAHECLLELITGKTHQAGGGCGGGWVGGWVGAMEVEVGVELGAG